MTPEGKRLERAIRWSNELAVIRKQIEDLQAEVRRELVAARHAVLEAEALEQDVRAVSAKVGA